jgi:all-trans-retinol dehydrogenase (NAD+)
MLFIKQEAIKDADSHDFQLVNVSSIAGHMTCHRNSDYSASKFALTGFLDALRQEMGHLNSNYKMTNFYPYYINTGLFEGFEPKLSWLIPTLDQNYVAERMYQAILAEEKEVYIEPIIYWLKVLTYFLPLGLKNKISHVFVG